MKAKAKCKKCGGIADVDTSKILTSNPPQYDCKCENCGEKFSCFMHEVSYVFENEEDGLYTGLNSPVTTTTNHYIPCKHVIDVKMVNGNYVSYCSKCGAILDTRCAWHY